MKKKKTRLRNVRKDRKKEVGSVDRLTRRWWGLGTWIGQIAAMVLFVLFVLTVVVVVIAIGDRFATGRRSMELIGEPVMKRMRRCGIPVAAVLRRWGRARTRGGRDRRGSRGAWSSAPMRVIAWVRRWSFVWRSDFTGTVGTGRQFLFSVRKMILAVDMEGTMMAVALSLMMLT